MGWFGSSTADTTTSKKPSSDSLDLSDALGDSGFGSKKRSIYDDSTPLSHEFGSSSGGGNYSSDQVEQQIQMEQQKLQLMTASLKAFMISSLVSFSDILAAIRLRKLSNESRPELSLSTSATIFLISSFLGSNPNALMATLRSLVSIKPLLWVSNKLNASRMSVFCSSDKSNLMAVLLRLAPPVILALASLCGPKSPKSKWMYWPSLGMILITHSWSIKYMKVCGDGVGDRSSCFRQQVSLPNVCRGRRTEDNLEPEGK
ncbi:hypothetical protein TCAL_16884 [Tigriopus californicus]|uniref:Uncharacterized protein n=1 Tax=Tigriopus californicus TaxID=6832 RepID=A0A553P696_TIGCA|nr:hypothetical protein TCAL_16884 [Tigriopus californicus]